MKKSKIYKTTALTVLLTWMIAALTACSNLKMLDVVGQQSITSFDKVLTMMPKNVTSDETNGGFSLMAPDETVRFIWSKDYSNSPQYDVMLELSAEPFINAGLNTAKLPGNYAYYDDMLMVGKKFEGENPVYKNDATPLSAYEQIVNQYRENINYHASLDHFGVMLGDGNMFEWAKDMLKNSTTGENQDKDIVFVLNPEPLIAAGVDPEKVEGWLYAQVEAEENGKMVDVYKFLKPFNLN